MCGGRGRQIHICNNRSARIRWRLINGHTVAEALGPQSCWIRASHVNDQPSHTWCSQQCFHSPGRRNGSWRCTGCCPVRAQRCGRGVAAHTPRVRHDSMITVGHRLWIVAMKLCTHDRATRRVHVSKGVVGREVTLNTQHFDGEHIHNPAHDRGSRVDVQRRRSD